VNIESSKNASVGDPTNPSGALPGDPRYGLNEEQLEDYYRAQSSSWIVHASLRGEGGLEATEAVMVEHLDYLRASADRIRFAGPTIDTDGTTRVGSIWLIDADSREAAEQWVAEEPFSAADAFGSVKFTRWSSSMEIRQRDYARTEGWRQFAITAWDGPDGRARRDAAADAHHAFQASVMDRYVARGPMFTDDGSQMIGSFMIVEFPDQAACDTFWAGEPLNTGGVFSEVRFDPWRYGAAFG
jgi:uncharacterized protein YciI